MHYNGFCLGVGGIEKQNAGNDIIDSNENCLRHYH